MKELPFYARPLAAEALDAPAMRVWRGIPYLDDADPVARLDIYRPQADPPRAGYPLLLFLHGGPVAVGDGRPWPKEWRVFQDYGRLAAGQGLAAAVLNHRYVNYEQLVPAAGDVAQALRYLAANAQTYGLDAGRYGLWAFSGAGMMLGPFLRGDAPGLRAVAAFYPMLDLTHVEQAREAYREEELIALSPLAHIELMPRERPIYIARAGLDKPGLNRTIDTFCAEALRRNLALQLRNLPAEGHGFDMFSESAAARSAVRDAMAFMKEHLGGPGSEPA